MYDFQKLVLGLAPTRRDTFPPPAEAVKNSKPMLKRLYEIFASVPGLEVVGIDDIVPDGLLCSLEDVNKATELFLRKKVDALFIPHANFGQEEAVAKLAKNLNVPVLLWGPRDGAPSPSVAFRNTDTQCGLFATGRALLRYGVQFTYIENCWLDSPVLERGINQFIRSASVVKAFKKMRVLQISTRPRQFLSVKVSEGELMERFGIEVTPVNAFELTETIDRVLERREDDIRSLINEWEQVVDLGAHSPEEREKMAAIELGILELADKYECITGASECWTISSDAYGVSSCFVFADLTAKGFGVACETDIHGAVSTAMLQAASRMQAHTFLADLTVRHPTNDNAELLWHCGPFPHTLAVPSDTKPKVIDGHGAWEIKGGQMTLCRFEADRGDYVLFADNARGVDGPPTTGNYVWVETANWPAWEKKLVSGPYIHHIVGAHGDYKAALHDACRYLGIRPDSVD